MDFRTFSEEEPTTETTDGEESVSMLSTLGGGESLPEGEPLGMEGVSDKAKLSTSTLAIGVVVVLGAAALFGMKLTLGGTSTDEATQNAIAEIEGFMIKVAEAEKVDAQGPLAAPTAESEKVFEQLKVDPTKHQVPSDEVEKNPFELVGIVRPDPEKPAAGPRGPSSEQILQRDLAAARKLKVNTIMQGRVPSTFINGELYRVGETIGNSIFSVHAIEDQSVVVKSSTSGNLIRMRYE